MMHPKFIPFVFKQFWRHRTRSMLTVCGVSAAMFLFVAVQTLQRSVRDATTASADDATLVVFRTNRFCPATSRLPERYRGEIERVPGVARVTPVLIVVNNCGASLDVVTFRGAPSEDVAALAANWEIVKGSLSEWGQRSDAAIVGERLALRRGIRVGDSFESSGVTVTVAAVIRSREPQEQNVVYVDLPYLQRSASRAGLGAVTQFLVRVRDPSAIDEVAAAIDETFRNDAEPTQTRPERAFVAQAAADVVEIVGFTRYLGWACLAAVLALVANAIVLSVQDRAREHAVLQTLGFRSSLIARLIVTEGMLLCVIGGAIGAGAAMAAISYGRFTLSNEGLSIAVHSEWSVVLTGFAIAAAVGVLAGLLPAIHSGRGEIAQRFRAV